MGSTEYCVGSTYLEIRDRPYKTFHFLLNLLLRDFKKNCNENPVSLIWDATLSICYLICSSEVELDIVFEALTKMRAIW